MAVLYHRDPEEKGMGNTRRPGGNLGDFLQPAERGIADQENGEGLTNQFFPQLCSSSFTVISSKRNAVTPSSA